MYPLKRYKIRSYEVGLHFRDGEFLGLLGEGAHWFLDPLRRVAVEVVSRRALRLVHEKLDLIAASGALKGDATVVDLKDDQRGLVWVDGRFAGVLSPGLYVYWTGPRDVHVELADVAPASVRSRGPEAHRPLPVHRHAAGRLHGRARLRGRVVPRRALR